MFSTISQKHLNIFPFFEGCPLVAFQNTNEKTASYTYYYMFLFEYVRLNE